MQNITHRSSNFSTRHGKLQFGQKVIRKTSIMEPEMVEQTGGQLLRAAGANVVGGIFKKAPKVRAVEIPKFDLNARAVGGGILMPHLLDATSKVKRFAPSKPKSRNNIRLSFD
jgi:hypothetical protein